MLIFVLFLLIPYFFEGNYEIIQNKRNYLMKNDKKYSIKSLSLLKN